MIDSFKKLHSYTPAPCTYNVSPKWKTTILGSMKGGKRSTFISQIFRNQEVKPSPGPGAHKINSRHTKKRNSLGIINNSERVPFTLDTEYLASSTPAAIYIDIMKKDKVKPFKWELKKKSHPWKVDKVDGPDPQSYPLQEKAIKEKIQNSSPRWKIAKSNRKFFTDSAQEATKNSPGAGAYNTINYNKIHRRLTSKRH